MDFIRQFRWSNYSNKKCKDYLRCDFKYQCAYCRLNERDTGVLKASAFEIDHFFPIALSSEYDGNINEYQNLFYSCSYCNRKKGNYWSSELLNPCKDDIYSEENPSLIVHGEEHQYSIEPQNDKGELFIKVFKLNSRAQRNNRREISEEKKRALKIHQLIDVLKNTGKNEIDSDSISKLIEYENTGLISTAEPIGNLVEAADYLTTHHIVHDFVFQPYNLDVKIEIDGISYYCEVFIEDSKNAHSKYTKRISKEKLVLWQKMSINVGLIYYYNKTSKMYFIPLKNILEQSDLDKVNKYKSFEINSSNLI